MPRESELEMLKREVGELSRRVLRNETDIRELFKLKDMIAEISRTVSVIDTKLGGMSRFFWIVIAAVVTGAIGVVFTSIVILIQTGGIP